MSLIERCSYSCYQSLSQFLQSDVYTTNCSLVQHKSVSIKVKVTCCPGYMLLETLQFNCIKMVRSLDLVQQQQFY